MMLLEAPCCRAPRAGLDKTTDETRSRIATDRLIDSIPQTVNSRRQRITSSSFMHRAGRILSPPAGEDDMSFPLGHFTACWRTTPKALREHHRREERSTRSDP
jgi:hypothetical protein